MKRWIAFLLALVMTMGLLTACGNKKTTGADDSGKASTTGTPTETTTPNATDSTASSNDKFPVEEENGKRYTISDTMANYYFVDYVRTTYMQIRSYYGDMADAYFAYMGLDVSKPLNAQYYQQPQTWAAYFLEAALDQAGCDLALCEQARAEGFQMSDADREKVESQVKNAENYASMLAYKSADDYLAAEYGAGADLESYRAYTETTVLAYAFYYAHRDSIVLSDAELDQYGEAYLSDLSDTQKTANVRHLLVEFKGGTANPLGGTTYSDEEKATAKAEAERLLQLWKDGDATEASFAALVTEHTDDPGSKETGGLYENVHGQTNFVEAFLNWSIDPGRKAGDTAIVETEYGYHIMFFSGYGAMSHRDYVADEQLREEQMEMWYMGVVENVSVSTPNVENLAMDMIISG